MLNKHRLALLVVFLAIAGGMYLYHSQGNAESKAVPDKHGEEAEAHEGEDGHAEETTLTEAALQKFDIEVLEAGSANISETVSVNGRIAFNQNTTAQVKARFPGVIRSVLKEPGEAVEEGTVLATVESNDSLQVYPVKSPVNGTVISRNANIGELAADAPLFVVADLSKLWAEMYIFSKDKESIWVGQKVRVICLDDPITADTAISLVLPTADASSQAVLVRAMIDNADQHWRAGMNIRADVMVSQKNVSLAVRTEAIQRMENQNVVFIQEGDSFKAQPVDIGTADAEWTEITAGLSAGQRYVAKNSFVVKADIGKAGAEHDH